MMPLHAPCELPQLRPGDVFHRTGTGPGMKLHERYRDERYREPGDTKIVAAVGVGMAP